MMKVQIKVIFQYENAAEYNKAYEKLCKCVENEIYQTLDDIIRRK